MSSCTVALSNSPAFSPSSSSSSSPRCSWLNKPRGRIRALIGGEPSPAPLLKRKRPARLDIPVVVVEEKVAASAVVPELEAGDGYSVCCKRGRKDVMEDRFSAVLGLQGDQKQAFFGVFDGHGGTSAAEFAAENLKKNIVNEIERSVDDEEIELAVKNGYLATDSEFLKQDARGGACCATALIKKGNLVVSNTGDCRAVLSRDGAAEALTSDHRPCRQDERERIENWVAT